MEIACADCGCVVDGGRLTRSCGRRRRDCCCHHVTAVPGYPGALLDALDSQLDLARSLTPDQLVVSSPCEGWEVRQVLNHSLAVTTKFAQFASGATDTPRTPEGDMLGDDHTAAVAAVRDAAHAAWPPVDLTRRCVLPFGTFPADVAAGINLFDVLAHTWDIAIAIRVDLAIDERLWTIGLHAAHAVIGADRDNRHYAPELPVDPAADARRRFLAFLGRDELALAF